MNINDDRQLTPKERAEISKRKMEMEAQKNLSNEESLSDFKKELGIPDKGNK